MSPMLIITPSRIPARRSFRNAACTDTQAVWFAEDGRTGQTLGRTAGRQDTRFSDGVEATDVAHHEVYSEHWWRSSVIHESTSRRSTTLSDWVPRGVAGPMATASL